jgi:peptidoglycan/LPS O-acetylase OafA/YrhL
MRGADGRLARLPALDGVRAIAILLVIAGHFIGFGGLGVAGVTVFFVLSGFLITRLLVVEIEAAGRLRFGRFYWRRACRILPAYMVWVAVTWLILGNAALPEDRRAVTGLLTYTYNYVTPTPWGFNSIIHPAWSLSVEEQFYLLWPLALALLTVARARRGLVFFFGAVVAWRGIAAFVLHLPQAYLDWAFETNACSLAAGCWLALYTLEGRPIWWTRFARPPAVTMALGLALSAICLGMQPTAGTALWAVPLATIVAFCLVSLALPLQRDAALAHPVLRWIGAISYSLYLWHLWGLGLGESLPVVHWLQLLIGLVIAVFLASASYYLIERPVMRWRDFVSTRAPVPA